MIRLETFIKNPWKTFAIVTFTQFSTTVFLLYLLITETSRSGNESVTKRIILSADCHDDTLDQDTATESRQLPTKSSKNLSMQTPNRLQDGSSVVCYGDAKKNRSCKFNNLCYSMKLDRYMFFHGPKTTVKGLPDDRFDPALLDLTSVDDHNTKYFNFIDFPISEIDSMDLREMKYIKAPAILFHRFNPENLMHVFHDDILPLWMTMRILIPGYDQPRTKLIMMDGREMGPWYHAYETISNDILLKANFTKYKFACFKEVIVGLLKDTTWYQYGFKVPQGPIPNSNVNAVHLRMFADEFKSRCECKDKNNQFVILVARKRTRLILNQLEVSISLANTFKKEVAFLDFGQQTLEEAICAVQNAPALVGMHGAELILSLFMAPGTILLEMFPFGIQPENYTPYKTLAALIGLKYIAWKNDIPENNKPHPERSFQLGGIHHLPMKLQKEIESSQEVPPHLCCNDPFWLYRIFQDTFVDTRTLQERIGLLTPVDKSNFKSKPIMYPDNVRDVDCNLIKSTNNTFILFATWMPPANGKYFMSSLQYQVIIQKNDDENVIAYEVAGTSITFKNVQSNIKYNIWIRCKSGGTFGPLSATKACDEN